MALLTYGARQVRIATPYSENFVNELKGTIEAAYRTWDAHAKIWTVFEPRVDEARRIVYRHYTQVDEVNKEDFDSAKAAEQEARRQAEAEAKRQREQRQQRRDAGFYRTSSSGPASGTRPESADPVADPYTVLELHPLAARDMVDAARKTLARRYHPDVARAQGISVDAATEAMKRVNQAYDSITKTRGW